MSEKDRIRLIETYSEKTQKSIDKALNISTKKNRSLEQIFK